MRLSPLEDLTPSQTALRDLITERRGGIHGPFQVLLRSPGLGVAAEALGTYCMGESALTPRVRELALLITARRFDAQHSWVAHLGKATDAGIPAAALERLARGDEPCFPDDEDDLVYRFAASVLDEHFVSDDIFAAGLARFGESGLVDLIGLLGNVALLAMLLNAFQVELPPGARSPW